MSVLITRPKYELVTHYLYYWSDLLIQEANRRKLNIFDLEKKKACRKLVESYLEKQKPALVIFNGHGNEVSVTGHDSEPLIESGVNSQLLKDKIVYMRSCDSGKILGPQSIRDGAKAFLGYKELFRFWTDGVSVANPLKDNYAQPFFETSNQVAISLIKGKTPKEAHAESLKLYQKVIGNLLTSNAENSFVVSDLIWNMSNQVCLE